MVEIENPQTVALKALLVSIGNAAVAFSIFGAGTATEVESVGVVLISVGAMFVNALHHKANAAIHAAIEGARPAMKEYGGVEAPAP